MGNHAAPSAGELAGSTGELIAQCQRLLDQAATKLNDIRLIAGARERAIIERGAAIRAHFATSPCCDPSATAQGPCVCVLACGTDGCQGIDRVRPLERP